MGNARRTLAASAASAFLAIGALAASAAPVAADIGPGPSTYEKKTGSGPEACPEDRYCLYDEPHFNRAKPTATIWVYKGTQRNLHSAESGAGGDQAQSIYNNTDDTISVYRDWLYSTTQCLLLPPFSVHSDLSMYYIENAISSTSTLPALQCRN
ncbi:MULTISPECIES: peptidase inhibitor family I36 protein [Streptomyces]|uniref:Peptidase inhibitor family I36 protein n=1 Tax=Streptomyces lycii TaxID=2654337 RepID=A0ABQ7FE37_9ACTN|nr:MULTISPECIES: peptidase inhibitor family I36 protein [Streptomyces]KAF4406258.1 hypothetical protein GCU69_25755 [Streptomyces lycii]PGH48821.1 hypothetical protein CRI70_20920 [Streptomyces sp. Ru87]